MKFTRLRQLALATFAFCGLTLGGQLTATASESIPSEVTMVLHKMENESDAKIKNTGDEITNLGDKVVPYDADKFGNVTYSIYDVTDYFKGKDGIEGQVNNKEFVRQRNAMIKDIVGGKTDPKELIQAQEDFVEKEKLKLVTTQELSGKSGRLEFDKKLTNSGFYLIMETAAPTKYLTGLSAPMIIGLPLTDKDTIHLYPKNVVADNVDPTIHKVGIDPENPTSDVHVALENVSFELKRDDGELLGNKELTQILTTGENGKVEFGGLKAGVWYVLTESSIADYPWYHQTEIKDHKVSLKFKVDKSGKITDYEASPNKKYFKIEEDQIGILNYLILGNASFVKLDGKTNKTLAGAKFKVQGIDGEGQMTWAVLDGNQFVKWTDKKSEGTELVSDEDGTFAITGVPYVYDQKVRNIQQYNLVETQAPTGYALLKQATKFEFTEKEITEIKPQIIENERYALPITGGMGIWLFLLIGAILMGGAGFMYYRHRKMA
ncbi:SpaA isopeptide-forming pilin-related protein [Levilactobacillus andaensis]|uniref:SpaA isopeptide-forming pilin-related protein n=1 Tax=Levilactobacillus andaensis TaxID=2799570 RepID=UPI0019404E20|nr:SpaA isopeptide-forming pilin-related protein [Levilactobacillus andaensis]